MKLTVLGCSGGIGSGRQTTCFEIDDDTLLDTGTGLTTLTLEQLALIDQVFLTHSHLDHVLGLPLLLDAVGERRQVPVTVYALPEVLAILDQHLFNWKVWPDFRDIPSPDSPWLRFHPVPLGSTIRLGQREFTALPADHVVPACAWHIRGPGGSLVFSGDTTSYEALILALNQISDLHHLIIETSFETARRDIAIVSKHHWPESLARDLARLNAQPQVWITHLKPGNEAAIMAELKQTVPNRNVQALQQQQVIDW
ncbi:MAG: 3',5'-cyclic-nucleotide phosphodiesterase [Thiobacillaceae bacterium]